MTYANRGPQHFGQKKSFDPSHRAFSNPLPEEHNQAEQKGQLEGEKLEEEKKQDKARHEKYALDRKKGIFHPGDPQTKIVEITDPAKKRMSRAEQERRIKDGSLPPEFADLHALIEYRQDPAHQRPPIELRGFRKPTPQYGTAFADV
jgi:integrase